MNKGVYVATSGSLAQERAMDIIANNLANMNTHGYKADRLLFQSYLQKAAEPGAAAPAPEEMKSGLFLNQSDDTAYMVGSESYTDLSQGALQKTGNPFDVALDDSGFISIQTPMGERFTRGGAFKLDVNGDLVTADGYRVSDENGGAIHVGNEQFTVQEDGTVIASGGVTGRIKVVDFADKKQLKKAGQGLFVAEEGAERIPAAGRVQQGYLEGSNINPVVEMTRMITALRTYEAFQKTIHSHDDMTTRLINDVGRP